MNIPEASTALSQMQLKQQVGMSVLKMGMDSAEQQAAAITEMAQSAGGAEGDKAAGAEGAKTIQDNRLGNLIDTQA